MADRQIPYPAETRAKGWRFEIDMEKVKASDTWLRAKTGEVRGALLLLWSEAWQQTPCGTLPNDDELVALLIDMPAIKFAKHRGVLMRGWWLATDGRLYHDTIVQRVIAMLDKRATDAERSAKRRAKQAGQEKTPALVTGASRVTPPGPTREFDTKHQAPVNSVPIGTGGEPPAASPPSARDEVFAAGVPLLTAASVSEKNARSMLAMLCKKHGESAVAAAITQTAKDGAGEPVSWIQNLLNKGAPERRGSTHTGFDQKDYREGVTADGSLA